MTDWKAPLKMTSSTVSQVMIGSRETVVMPGLTEAREMTG